MINPSFFTFRVKWHPIFVEKLTKLLWANLDTQTNRLTDGGYFIEPSLTQVNKIMHVKIFPGISNYSHDNLITINIFVWSYGSGTHNKIRCDFPRNPSKICNRILNVLKFYGTGWRVALFPDMNYSSYLGKKQLFSLLLLGYVAVHVGNLKLNPG